MSALETGSRVKSKNVIQYASDQINNPMLEGKDTMTGIKTIVSVDKKVKEAILLHESEKDKIIDTSFGKTPIVTRAEIEEEMSHWGR